MTDQPTPSPPDPNERPLVPPALPPQEQGGLRTSPPTVLANPPSSWPSTLPLAPPTYGIPNPFAYWPTGAHMLVSDETAAAASPQPCSCCPGDHDTTKATRSVYTCTWSGQDGCTDPVADQGGGVPNTGDMQRFVLCEYHLNLRCSEYLCSCWKDREAHPGPVCSCGNLPCPEQVVPESMDDEQSPLCYDHLTYYRKLDDDAWAASVTNE